MDKMWTVGCTVHYGDRGVLMHCTEVQCGTKVHYTIVTIVFCTRPSAVVRQVTEVTWLLETSVIPSPTLSPLLVKLEMPK